ncbi:MAG: alkylhydroperoxidase/carboxymuconolactone decarboxylase family protein YurZ [Planctomycetota bacterium]|jgi:alkylhydroperoxidase/carboxymuconolactone decarboxylase family protein YurZ
MEPIEFADLARLTAAIVCHDVEALREFGKRFARLGHAPEFHEVLLQCHLFCGFPRTLAGLDLLRDAGMQLKDPGFDDPAGGAGKELFDKIYAGDADRVRDHLAGLSPTFATWIADHAYGRVLAREGLSPVERECLAVVALAATGHDRQLASHVRGAVRCGARPEDVMNVLDFVDGAIPEERLKRAREIAGRFAQP